MLSTSTRLLLVTGTSQDTFSVLSTSTRLLLVTCTSQDTFSVLSTSTRLLLVTGTSQDTFSMLSTLTRLLLVTGTSQDTFSVLSTSTRLLLVTGTSQDTFSVLSTSHRLFLVTCTLLLLDSVVSGTIRLISVAGILRGFDSLSSLCSVTDTSQQLESVLSTSLSTVELLLVLVAPLLVTSYASLLFIASFVELLFIVSTVLVISGVLLTGISVLLLFSSMLFIVLLDSIEDCTKPLFNTVISLEDPSLSSSEFVVKSEDKLELTCGSVSTFSDEETSRGICSSIELISKLESSFVFRSNILPSRSAGGLTTRLTLGAIKGVEVCNLIGLLFSPIIQIIYKSFLILLIYDIHTFFNVLFFKRYCFL